MNPTTLTNSQKPRTDLCCEKDPIQKLIGKSMRRTLLLVIFMHLYGLATAQFSGNHQYVIGGYFQASNDLDFLNLRAGRVLNNENVLGLSIYANDQTLSGISGWYRIVKELEVVSLPIFYKVDTELGYFEDNSVGLFFSPGFTIRLTKRSYLDLSIAAIRLHYEDELDSLVSLNNMGIGLVFGI